MREDQEQGTANEAGQEIKILVERFKKEFLNRLHYSVGADRNKASDHELYMALAFTARDQMTSRWIATRNWYNEKKVKRVYYLSLEFLMGRSLRNILINLGLEEVASKALSELGMDFAQLVDIEWDAGLGNGGLGRLAACYMDSLATLNYPCTGYGIRYEFGMFEQKIVDNKQQEFPDTWLRHGNPYDIERAYATRIVNFGGRLVQVVEDGGELAQDRAQFKWIETEQVLAVGYDTPIPGYGTDNANTLRLWTSRATREFNLKTFDQGDYMGAVDDKNRSETISKVLYPNDNTSLGKELRLRQQYFMVSATIQDIIYRFKRNESDFNKLPDQAVIHLNDTHPVLAIPELLRILIDEHNLEWDQAWSISQKLFAFTNHTLLPEALETWPVSLMERLLPRHMQIIYDINYFFLEQVSIRFPGDFPKRERLSIIMEGHEKQVRMAHLAIVGSFSVNGVAALHSQLITKTIFSEFHQMFPERFNNKTNGVTPRRWLRLANPKLSSLITSRIGDGWIKDLFQLQKLESMVEDSGFVSEWIQVKQANKERLAAFIANKLGISLDTNGLFDTHIKRIHEYKRQLLKLLHAIHLYFSIKDQPQADHTPRTIIFGGKAAPGYHMAKSIIHLINSVSKVINGDPTVNPYLKLVFVPNYGVSLAEMLIPATDLSEQISTAGYEASGTGNMKFAMNGALTIGTLDGANIEILEAVGSDNIFIFGLDSDEITDWRNRGYHPGEIYQKSDDLQRILGSIRDGFFDARNPTAFRPIYDLLKHHDPYFVLADFDSYLACQATVEKAFRNPQEWHRKAIINCQKMGRFSSDRAITEYAEQIWGIQSCPITCQV